MSPRVEVIGDATLYLGDCREVAPGLDGSAVCDPPYGMGYDTDSRRFSGRMTGDPRGQGRADRAILGDDGDFDPVTRGRDAQGGAAPASEGAEACSGEATRMSAQASPQVEVEVYSYGLCHCSVCAPVGMSADEVCAAVNRTEPSGTEGGWTLTTEKAFRGGETIPHPCPDKATRQHWLLDC